MVQWRYVWLSSHWLNVSPTLFLLFTLHCMQNLVSYFQYNKANVYLSVTLWDGAVVSFKYKESYSECCSGERLSLPCFSTKYWRSLFRQMFKTKSGQTLCFLWDKTKNIKQIRFSPIFVWPLYLENVHFTQNTVVLFHCKEIKIVFALASLWCHSPCIFRFYLLVMFRRHFFF